MQCKTRPYNDQQEDAKLFAVFMDCSFLFFITSSFFFVGGRENTLARSNGRVAASLKHISACEEINERQQQEEHNSKFTKKEQTPWKTRRKGAKSVTSEIIWTSRRRLLLWRRRVLIDDPLIITLPPFIIPPSNLAGSGEWPAQFTPQRVPRLADHSVAVDKADLFVVEGSILMRLRQDPLDPSGGWKAPAEFLAHRQRDEEDEGQVNGPARRQRVERTKENSLPILGRFAFGHAAAARQGSALGYSSRLARIDPVVIKISLGRLNQPSVTFLRLQRRFW